MCGICGIHDPNGNINDNLIRRMSDILTHRGPDDEGFHVEEKVGLGFKRLSIIDLELGNQPMANEDGSVWIVYNGEIYNFPVLKEELLRSGHQFRTKSDTEVIIHGYEEWGEDVVQKLNGMFAFALWDAKKERMFLARDRLGIKPLYYRLKDDRLIFASEIKALVADESLKKKVNPKALVDYLTFQNVFGSKTFFKGIEKILPGHYAVKDEEGFRTVEYWDLDFEKGPEEDEGHYVEKYREMLKKSVKMELVSDVPVGFHLSGGIDSCSVAVSAVGEVDKFRTFSGSFPEEGFDESPFACQVARSLDAERHKVSLSSDQVTGMLAKMVYHLDEPRVGPGSIPQYYVAQLASQHVKVVLTGHGGDELFAGYPSYLYPHLREVLGMKGLGHQLVSVLGDLRSRSAIEGWKRTVGLPVYTTFNRDLKRYAREAVFSPRELRRLLAPRVLRSTRGYSTRRELEQVRERHDGLTPLEKVQYLDIKTYLPSLLDNEDRLSMAFSLESRVPILDHEIAEFSSKIPSKYKIDGLTLKNVPRKAAKGLIPDDVINHKKMGFPVPLASWLRDGLGDYARDVLLGVDAKKRGIFDMQYVELLLDEHSLGIADHSEKIWCLLNFELWNRVFIDSDSDLFRQFS
jgi:asparagine synthase (glutamine-hydrolysing)